MKTKFSFADYIAIIGGFQTFRLKVAECNSAKTAFRRFHDNGYRKQHIEATLFYAVLINILASKKAPTRM